ncbi:fimbrillin family protein [Parasphaerochaeta coccoides]|uniref:Regulator of chromosome condensation RCC1 n=1 Tax=Parasphaerochaeta coccoides (strain ATCC BAA-1237 / DSM 17374 / SPN1) TaxID=760011 RepID=F4GLY9_PARC1|nr:fimbrillin family protein [Parasphaerochaeta coccoides]AEC03030.1 regulator of chromosome condensation RCC1 [Parasphaerochaeta coccoides DSM 17374]
MNKFSRPVFIVLTTILILLVALVSCDSKLNVSNTNAVRFSTEIGRKVTANSEWQADDEVGIYMLEHGTGTAATTAPERANRHYTADMDSQASGFSPVDNANTLKWNDIADNADDTFDFISYYPWAYLNHNETGAGTTSFYDTDTLYIDINRDRGTHEQDTGKADVLWGRTDNVQNNTSTVRLKLDHMLSRLIVNITPSTTVDAVAINDATAFVATVKGLDNITTMNLDDGSLADVSGLAAPIAMKDISDTLTQSERDEGKRRFEAVLIPVGNTLALANVSLEFVLTGGARAGTYTWIANSVATSDQGKIHFDKGKQHVYNMTLNTSDDEVAVAAIELEIKDWDAGDGINAPAVKVGIKSVAVGHNHMMILKTDGTLWATGDGQYGALGLNSTEAKIKPVKVTTTYTGSDLPPVKAVSAGTFYTMIVDTDGKLWGTGGNEYGHLGIGDTGTNKFTFVEVTSIGTNFKSVSAGNFRMMVVTNDDELLAIGENSYGQLGVGDAVNKDTFTEVMAENGVDDMTDVASVSLGTYYTMIVRSNGDLWAVGRNESQTLGVGSTQDPITTPMPVWDSLDGSVKMTGVTSVSIGDFHAMILKDGDLWTVGYSSYGQLGLGVVQYQRTPAKVMDDVKAVSTGVSHTMILKTDGTLWATGRNQHGQLGVGDNLNKNTPVPVTSMGNQVAAVFAGGNSTIILKKDGTLWATGLNNRGQLGDGTTANKNTPVQVIL